jgi:hypothetical protein
MKRILFVILAGLLIALAWRFKISDGAPRSPLALGRGAQTTDHEGESTLEHGDSRAKSDADDVRVQIATSASSSSTSSPTRLRVRSSTGLELLSVELEVEERSWRSRDLDDGSCAIDDVHLPCGVRAGGHLASIARRADEEVVLEPDALLILDGEELRECVPSIAPFGSLLRQNPARAEWEARVASMLTSGFVDANHWAMAASTPRIGEAFTRDDEVSIELQWRDHRFGYVEFFAHAGTRGQYTLPCDSAEELAPLDVEIEVPKTDPRGAIDVAISRTDRKDENVVVVKQPWGQVQRNPPASMFIKSHLDLGSTHVHWDGVALHESYLLRAHDVSTGALGCTVFVHDGRARTVSLHAGIVVHGRLVTPDGSPPLRGSCFWEGFNPTQKDVTGSNFSPDLKTAPNGEFELRGYENLPWNDAGCREFPAQIELSLQMIGFDEIARTFPVDGAGHCECGEIVLVPRKPTFVLAAGHRIAGDSLSYLNVHVSSHPTWFLSNVRGSRLPDGSFALYPEIDSNDKSTLAFAGSAGEGTESIPASALADAVIEALLVAPLNSGGLAFRRLADGRYERVHERSYTVDVDCRAMPTQRESWTLGWSWSGMAQYVSSLSKGVVGERRKLEFSAPESGVSFWWSSTGEPLGPETRVRAEGGEADLSNGTLAIRVP